MKYIYIIIPCSTRNTKVEEFQIQMVDSFEKNTPDESKSRFQKYEMIKKYSVDVSKIFQDDYFDQPNIKFGVKSAVDLFFKENIVYRTEYDSPENNNRWSWIVTK